MAAISWDQVRLGSNHSNSRTRSFLPLAMSLPSFVWITRILWEKSEKMWFQTLKTAAIFPSSRMFRSNSQTRCSLPLAMSLPRFAGVTRIDLEKSAKNLISNPETGRHFPGSRSFDVKFAELKHMDKVPLTPTNVHTKFHWNKQNTYKYIKGERKL